MNTERDENPAAGHYELRDETRLGVQVVGIYWVNGTSPASLMVTLDRSRVPLLGQAVARYLAGNPAGPGAG